MSPAPTSSLASVTASYSSLSEASNTTFTHPISAPIPTSATDTKAKVAYLSDLRCSAKQLQDDVNKFLTQKMEEDKANVASMASGMGDSKAGKRLDDEAEENYGEEKEDDAST